MNKPRADPTIAAAMAALEDLGITSELGRTPVTADDAYDALIRLRTPAGTHEYRAEIKRHVSRALLGAIRAAFAAQREESLLVTDHVTPPLADEFRRSGIQFIDGAGNAFLQRPGLFVFISGRKPAKPSSSARTPRVFRGAGLKTIFALLSLPELVNATHREIAAAATVALGNVPTILEGLRELGFVDDIRGERRVLDQERLIKQWTEAYVRTIEPKLELSRFSASDPKWWRRADAAQHSAQWGGETAAALLHRHLVPERAMIYVARVPSKMLLEHRLRADPNGNVVFRQRFWNFTVPWKHDDLVPPLLIYADLLAAGDGRSVRAAAQIHDEFLARPVED